MQGEHLWAARTGPEEITLTTLALDGMGPQELEALRTYALEHLSMVLAHTVPSTPVPVEEKKKGSIFPLFRLGRAKASSSAAPPSPSAKSLAPRPASVGDAPRLFGLPLDQVSTTRALTLHVRVCMRAFIEVIR
jgi:hypothetical protein